jgi:hypothetical protein
MAVFYHFSNQTDAEILTHISCALSFGAFLVRDILWLRLLAIGSSLVWIAAMAFSNWIAASLFWNGIFIAINTYNIGVLLNDNRSVSFTDEERELYETLFRSFRPGEFLKMIRIAKWRNAKPGEILLREGDSVDGVGLIMEGSAEVTLRGEDRARLGDLDLFGEMGYLSGEPATGTVKAQTPIRYVWWNKEELTGFFKKHPSLKVGYHSVVTDDLRKKLLRGGKSDWWEPGA